MKKSSLVMSLLVVVAVLVTACGQSQPPEAPPPPEKGTLRVEVSRNGFNNTPGAFRLEVEEGQEVEITFVYGDKDFSQNNPHIISVPALGITTTTLDQDNPEETLRFTASETGDVAFMCTKVDCVGHNNLLGGLIVIQSGG